MDNNELNHHGVLGMKWGIRRSPAQLGHKPSSSNKSSFNRNSSSKTSRLKESKKASSKVEAPKKKQISEMSEEEINKKIKRMQLEKTYKQLTSELNPKKVSKGRLFVLKVLEKSGENIATQLTTYAMGTVVNKVASKFVDDDRIVNPKKGQKDK